MNMEYQDTNKAIQIVEKRFTKNPNSSISATFKKLRNNSSLSFIGDYILLAVILNTLKKMEIKSSRYQVWYAMNKSSELSLFSKQAKNALLEQLVKPSHVQMKEQRNVAQQAKNRKLTNVSSKEIRLSFYE